METRGSFLDCGVVRDRFVDLRRKRLPPAERDAVILHVRTCPECRRIDEAEALLDRVLIERLPRPELPASLRDELGSMCAEADARSLAPAASSPDRPRRGPLWSRSRNVLAVAAVALLALGGVLLNHERSSRGASAADEITNEAVADHLRVLTALHPHDIESDDSHNVKPWFEGRLDFAPNVPSDVSGLKLRGGNVGYFLGRKAAVISYALRQHAVTLLSFPAEGLSWPSANRTLDGVPVRASTDRGIHVVLWKHGDIGYAAVADVAPEEFLRVAGQLARKTGS